MNKGFVKALNDIKKQAQKQGKQRQEDYAVRNEDVNPINIQQLSSDQQKKLEKLGALKKTKSISKNSKVDLNDTHNKWKHDHYQKMKAEELLNDKISKRQQPINHPLCFSLKFSQKVKGNRILSLLRSYKAYIQEFDENHITFSQMSQYYKSKASNCCDPILQKTKFKQIRIQGRRSSNVYNDNSYNSILSTSDFGGSLSSNITPKSLKKKLIYSQSFHQTRQFNTFNLKS